MKVVGAAGVAAGVMAAAWWARKQARPRPDHGAPLALTVHRPYQELVDDDGAPRPEELRSLSGRGRLELTPAPGTFGTEVRLYPDQDCTTCRSEDRQALRAAKQLLETGATMPPDSPVTRRRTVTSIPLEIAIRRAGAGGRL